MLLRFTRYFLFSGIIAAAAGAPATSSMNAQHPVYDVAKDFSTTKNPNGVWSYGYESKLGSRFIRNVKHVHVSGLDACQGALSSVPLQAPVVFHNGPASTVTYLTLRMQAGQLAIHPGPHGEFGVARWIAPRAGAFRIRAIFSGVDTVGTTTDVHVLVGGVRIFDAAIDARSSRAELNRVVSLKNGAIVDFAVGMGADGTYYYDTTALAATISEYPVSFALAGNWVYYNNVGKAQIRQSGNNVTMLLTWTANHTRGPTYKVLTTLSGHTLIGAWRCLVGTCGFEHGKFHAVISASGNRITVSNTDDPGGANRWNGVILTRVGRVLPFFTPAPPKPPPTSPPAPAAAPTPAPWCYQNSGSWAAIGPKPCYGPPGTVINVFIFVAHPPWVPYTALNFRTVPAPGVPALVTAPLMGASAPGNMMTAAAPAGLCLAKSNSKWKIWLANATQEIPGQIGDFTITGCP